MIRAAGLTLVMIGVMACSLSAQAPASKTVTKTQQPATKSPAPPSKAQPPATKAAAPGGTKAAPQSKAVQPPAKTPATPATKTVTQAGTKAPPPQGGRGRPGLTIATGDTMSPPPAILREVFDYQRNGRRDPFVSLLATTDLRPTLDELNLLGILYDAGGGSVAMLHDGANKQYRIRVGTTLGRMRVTAIRPKAVIFTIEEFGANRQDSLVLNDSTRTRRP